MYSVRMLDIVINNKKQLKELYKPKIKVKLEHIDGPNGWPVFSFGSSSKEILQKFIKQLGYSKDDFNEYVERKSIKTTSYKKALKYFTEEE